MIRHIVPFRLKHAAGSAEEAAFLTANAALRDIPGVLDFDLTRQVSAKNAFTFVVSMAFTDQATYQAYNVHPAHVAFVQEHWSPEVVDFIEIDTVAI